LVAQGLLGVRRLLELNQLWHDRQWKWFLYRGSLDGFLKLWSDFLGKKRGEKQQGIRHGLVQGSNGAFHGDSIDGDGDFVLKAGFPSAPFPGLDTGLVDSVTDGFSQDGFNGFPAGVWTTDNHNFLII
jgi:hypothetical protein